MNDQPSQPCMALAVPHAWVQVAPIGRPVFVSLRTDADLLAQYERRYEAAAMEAGRADAAPGKIRYAAFLLAQVVVLQAMFGIREGAPA